MTNVAEDEEIEILLGALDCTLEEIAERKAFLFTLMDNDQYYQKMVNAAYKQALADYNYSIHVRSERENLKMLKIYRDFNTDEAKETFKKLATI